MAHREPNPFADEDHGAFPAEGGHRLQRGWYGDDGTFVPSPSTKTSRSRLADHHRADDAMDAGGSSASADDGRETRRLRERVAHLETTNARLEREIRSLRALASASANETTAVRVDALRHLIAAEDHVRLLHDESESKLATLRAEMASVGGDAARGATGEGTGGPSTSDAGPSTSRPGPAPGPGPDAADAETRLRDEVRRFAAAQAEMDAEAEEREAELGAAWDKIRELQEALRAARGGR